MNTLFSDICLKEKTLKNITLIYSRQSPEAVAQIC